MISSAGVNEQGGVQVHGDADSGVDSRPEIRSSGLSPAFVARGYNTLLHAVYGRVRTRNDPSSRLNTGLKNG